METWTVAKAKAKFSEVIELARSSGPQTITKHGHPTVVILSAKDWEKRTRKHDSLVNFFAKSPLVGSGIKLKRISGKPREINL